MVGARLEAEGWESHIHGEPDDEIEFGDAPWSARAITRSVGYLGAVPGHAR